MSSDFESKVLVQPTGSWGRGQVVVVEGYKTLRRPVHNTSLAVPVWVANYLLTHGKIAPFATPSAESAPVVETPVEAVPEAVEAPVEAIAEEVVEPTVEAIAEEEALEPWQAKFLKFVQENEVPAIKEQFKGKGVVIGERVIEKLKVLSPLTWPDVEKTLNPKQRESAQTFANAIA